MSIVDRLEQDMGFLHQLNSRSRRQAPYALALLFAMAMSAATGQESNPDPARFEAEIAAFEASDAEKQPLPGTILFLGSSSIRLWQLEESFPDLPTVNRGFGGSHYSDVLHFADRILALQKPRAIVLYAGDNDIAAGKTPRYVADDCSRLMARLREHHPSARIVVIAIKPSPSRWEHFPAMQQANALIRAEVEKLENAEWVDIVAPMLGRDGLPCRSFFVEDCLHMNQRGYQVWSCLVGRAIRCEPFQTGS